jgi:hypothetical protein
MSRRPILVTGSHRSGTTWTGAMLAAAHGVGYIHEPFNPAVGPGVFAPAIRRWFTYVGSGSSEIEASLERTLAFEFDHRADRRMVRDPGTLKRHIRTRLAFARSRRQGHRPLLKDPIAVLSAEWIARRFDADVVVMIRHPAGFVGSLKRLGWTHDFSSFLEQEELMRDHLGPFAAEIEDFAAHPRPIVEQGALLWRLFYSVVDSYRRSNPSWSFVRLEDLWCDPFQSFRDLYARLGLEYTPRIDNRIVRTTRPSRTETLLTPSELAAVAEGVGELVGRFYDDRGWDLRPETVSPAFAAA